MVQNWNGLLKYIKLKLGVPTNLLEFTDDDIISYIKENVMAEISGYLFNFTYFRLTTDNINQNLANGVYEYVFEIPVPDDMEIIDVHEVWFNRVNVPIGQLTSSFVTLDPRDIVMQNTMVTMLQDLQTIQEYEFERPNILYFGLPVFSDVIVQCRTVYTDLNKMPSDTYHEIFKKKCLAEIMLLIVAQRKKYEGLTTPFGQLNINWQEMEGQAKEILGDIDSKLDAMPPQYLVAWLGEE